MDILKQSIRLIFIKIKDKLEKFSLKITYWKLEANPKIIIHDSVRLKKSTLVECRYGGQIFIGKGTELLENVLILTYGGDIKIGEGCSINAGTIIYGVSSTIIGNNVLIAGGCMIIPTNHRFDNLEANIRDQGLNSSPIIIEDNVWIGHGCSILAGIRIGEGSVIAAGSVVNKDVPPFSVMAGVPAKIVKKRIK